MVEGTIPGKGALERIPRWLYFVLIVGSMAYITLNPIGLPIPVTDLTRATFNTVDSLNPGDIILIDMDYDPGTIAIHEPGLVVVLKHAMRVGAKILMVSGREGAPMIFDQMIAKVNPESRGYEYGKDWVYLGYFAPSESAYAAIIEDVNSVFTVDYDNTPIAQLPLMQEVSKPTHEKISLVYVLSPGGDVCEGWIRQSAVRYNIPMIQQPLEMMVPTMLPYYPINLQGILNGGIGAAEYETLSGFAGDAVKLSDMLSMGGIIVLIFLILGNIGWFMRPKGGA